MYFISNLIATFWVSSRRRGVPNQGLAIAGVSHFCEILCSCISDCRTNVSQQLPSLSGQRRPLLTQRVDAEGAGSSGWTISWFARDVWSSICSGRFTQSVSAAPCRSLSWPTTPAGLRGSGWQDSLSPCLLETTEVSRLLIQYWGSHHSFNLGGLAFEMLHAYDSFGYEVRDDDSWVTLIKIPVGSSRRWGMRSSLDLVWHVTAITRITSLSSLSSTFPHCNAWSTSGTSGSSDGYLSSPSESAWDSSITNTRKWSVACVRPHVLAPSASGSLRLWWVRCRIYLFATCWIWRN